MGPEDTEADWLGIDPDFDWGDEVHDYVYDEDDEWE